MTAAATTPPAGQSRILGTYKCDEGTRQLVAQRINGKVALRDVPARDDGKVYLVERYIPSLAELEGVVADYCQLARELNRPPMAGDWICQ
jgi:hypothetical protein